MEQLTLDTQMLWIGCLESDEEFEIKAKKGYNLASAQISQKNLLYGLEKVSNIIFDSINGSVLPPYPVYADRVVRSYLWSHSNDSFDISVGYKNDKYINRLNCKNAMIVAAKDWIVKRYKGGELQIFVYSMRSAPMATACYIKKRIPKAKIYLIVTDLPQFMDLGESKLKATLKQIDWYTIKKMQTQFDGFILYAAQMAKFLEISDDKWMLMEGSYDYEESVEDNLDQKKLAIMYSGKLDKEYGIRILLEAFMSIIDPEIELWLTGGGNAESYIKECAIKDRRIKFFGFLPSRRDVLVKQKQAMLLINMRLPSEIASNYCFPSKLFEYMATGIPVLSFRIGGIPDEYYNYLISLENESVEALRKAILNVIDMPIENREELGRNAREFILKNKNATEQARKIITWINERY